MKSTRRPGRLVLFYLQRAGLTHMEARTLRPAEGGGDPLWAVVRQA